MEVAVLAGGCFWCLEAAYRRVKGVVRVESGYAGGSLVNPGYEAVCRGDTGHAEVVRLEFDPAQISYREILELFFALHDPTTLNRQGNDIGSQYRSAIFPVDEQQRELAREAIEAEQASGRWDNPVVTTIEQADEVYIAEDYHQDYLANNPGNPYCRAVVVPKLRKFFSQHGDRLD